jgi:hypothetical protein
MSCPPPKPSFTSMTREREKGDVNAERERAGHNEKQSTHNTDTHLPHPHTPKKTTH